MKRPRRTPIRLEGDPLTPFRTVLPVTRFPDGTPWMDAVAVEEPLELRLYTPSAPVPLGVLMRTPGAERELLLGWLLSEGLLPDAFELAPDPDNPNLWHLHTKDHERLAAGARLAVSSSACGVCGTGSVERLLARASAPRWTAGPLSAGLLADLPEGLRAAQPGFAQTGGLHGAGLMTAGGDLRAAFEDVGRHNAVDRVVGWAQLQGEVPLTNQVLVVSSRAGFEIVQKAVVAGVAVVVAVGAATSLAVDTAAAFGVTLCGFAREGRLTVYAGAERVTA